MKLSPADLLHLVENTTTKTERLDFLYAKEACFGDVPATLNYALSTVSVERARYCWGLEGSKLRKALPNLQFPSLRPNLPEPESDFADENLMFGIVDVGGRDVLEGLEFHIAGDSVETGEWDRYCGQIGTVPGSVVVETDAEE